ncbi:MAG: hypothetical protein AAFU70_06660, partial [Planctomycetota bacterium]
VVCLQMEGAEPGAVFFFAGVDGVKWKRPVVPGDTLVMEVQINAWKARFGIAKASGKAYVDGSIADLLNAISPPGGFTVVEERDDGVVAENFVAFFGSFGGNEGIGANGSQDLFSIQVTAGGEGLIDLTPAVSALSITTGANDAGFVVTDFDVIFESARVEVVPTPGAAAVLGLGGLVAARRRR